MDEKASLLPRVSVTRPVTVTMCLVALLVVGLVAYSRMRVQAFPSGNDFRSLWVDVYAPNSSPQELDQQVCRPMEEYLRTVKNLRQIQTWSNSGWGAWARLDFRQGTDMSLAYNQVFDRVERLKLELSPDHRDRVFIWKWNQETDLEIMWVGVSLPPGVEDPYHFLETRVQRPLERIDKVAKVEIWGADEKEVMIEVDRSRMQALRVSPYALVEALQRDNFALAGGYVHEGDKKFYVRSLARYASLEEIENIPVSNGDVRVRLKDVARVVYDVPERTWGSRINGRPAVTFGVYRESGANLSEMCRKVEAALGEIEAKGEVRFRVFFNQGKLVEESIANLRNTGLWGGLFAALVLLFYVRAARMTAIITMAIPLCVMIAVTVLYFMDWSLNLYTMMGLMVGVGMVVDNAIVIVENIYRMRGRGMGPESASVRGASEVGLAITMATLTTVVVFLPLMLMGGDENLTFLLSRIGVPVVLALVASLFVALLFIPLAAVRFGGSGVKPDPGSIRWMRAGYGRWLAWTLAHRKDAVLIVLAVCATVWFPMQKVKQTDRMGRNLNDVWFTVRPPQFFSLEDQGRLAEEFEVFLEGKRKLYGIETVRVNYWKTGMFIRAFLKEEPNRAWWYQAYRDLRKFAGYPVDGRMDRKAVIEDLKRTMPQFVGVRVSIQSWNSNNDPAVSVYLFGDDLEVLEDLAGETERRLRTIPSVISVDSDMERGEHEVRVRIDREQARKYGISARDVGRSIAQQVGGVNLPRYHAEDREIEVQLRLNREDRRTLSHLKTLTFRAVSGEEIPLSAFASFTVAQGAGTVRRKEGKMRLRVTVFTTKEDLKGLYAEVDRAMQGFEMPRGYSWDKGERYSKFQEADDAMLFAVVMAVTFVFLLMGVLFESFILPFSVLLSIPFAFLGVYWALYVTGTVMGFMARMGVILLIGVVVNNAIVLVDMVNRLREGGMGRREAILEAGHNRFRPILMTTFTTVFGLLPMAVGSSTMMGVPYAPLGRTMMGGLICSTFLTLFVVPLFYTFLDDLRLAVRRLAAGAFWHRGEQTQAAD